VEEKIRNAGADAVISPSRIGGLRMISELLRPTAVSYLDLMLRDKEKNLRIESTPISPGSELAGGTLEDLKQREIPDLLVLALRRSDKSWDFAPPDDARLDPGLSLIYMGSPQARQAVEELAAPRS
jgi:voltage-gated potassium channel